MVNRHLTARTPKTVKLAKLRELVCMALSSKGSADAKGKRMVLRGSIVVILLCLRSWHSRASVEEGEGLQLGFAVEEGEGLQLAFAER